MRVESALLGALTVIIGCAHQEVAPPAPTPRPVPVAPAPAPRVVKTYDDSQALSMQMMAGNVEPIEGDDPSLPDQVINTSHGQVLEGAYKVCIASDGKVQSVTPVTSIEGADECIVNAIKAWRFPRLPMTVCKVQTLRFEIP